MFHLQGPSQTRPYQPALQSKGRTIPRFSGNEDYQARFRALNTEDINKLGQVTAVTRAEKMVHTAEGDTFGKTAEQIQQTLTDYYYAIEKMHDNYKNKLSDRARQQVDHLKEVISADKLGEYRKKEKLGLVEESSDMFFELYTMRALHKGLITPEQVKKWEKQLPIQNPDEKGKPSGEAFRKFRAQIRQDIVKSAKPSDLKAFQKMDGWNDEKAIDLLALIGLKCALMTKKNPNYNIFTDNRSLLNGEADELNEKIRDSAIHEKLWIKTLAEAYTYLDFLPASFFKSQVTHITEKNLKHNNGKFPINYNDLMETVYSKQIGRQELDFSHPEIDERLQHDPQYRLNEGRMKAGNKDRKCILKPYELWQEAAILRNAEQNHKEKAEDVLQTKFSLVG